MKRTATILLAFLTIVGAAQGAPVVGQGAPVRAVVGKPLKEAQDLIAKGNYKAATAKINEADAVPNQTAEESSVIAQMKVLVASRQP
jgi:hypothetical protein